MTPNNRQCPFTGCDQRISPAFFACRKHWFKMPREIQDRVVAAYRQYKDSKLGVNDLRAIQDTAVRECEDLWQKQA